MPISSSEKEFVAHVLDLMTTLGPVSARAMFGGHGIYLDGRMFALIADGVLYLKADATLAEEFRARGLPAFTYLRKGRRTAMSYYQAPEDVLEDSAAMRHWAGRAWQVAMNAAEQKRRRPPRCGEND